MNILTQPASAWDCPIRGGSLTLPALISWRPGSYVTRTASSVWPSRAPREPFKGGMGVELVLDCPLAPVSCRDQPAKFSLRNVQVGEVNQVHEPGTTTPARLGYDLFQLTTQAYRDLGVPWLEDGDRLVEGLCCPIILQANPGLPIGEIIPMRVALGWKDLEVAFVKCGLVVAGMTDTVVA